MSSHSRGPGGPDVIYVIRHGEKPADAPTPAAVGRSPSPVAPFGVDFDGNQNIHSLVPRGWQRSGALAVLFDPAVGAPEATLRTPSSLISPDYGGTNSTQSHRTYQTIQGLSERLGLKIDTPFPEGAESHLARSVLSSYSGVVLICWEHQHIPAITAGLPTTGGSAIPSKWPGDRFDVVWVFTAVSGSDRVKYAFAQVPQQILAGDTDTVITTT